MQNLIVDIKRTWEPGATLPVTLAEAKEQCLVTHSTDDLKITSLITQCIKAIESECQISIIYQTVIFIGDIHTDYTLPYGPVISISAVQTRASEQGSGIPSYETSTRIWQINGDQFGVIGWGDCGCSINTRYNYNHNRYRIVYRAGMESVPEDLKLAILNEIAFRYEHKGDEPGVGVSEGTKKLIQPYISYAWQ